MKTGKKKLFVLLILFINVTACDKFNNCEGILCFTPPPGFFLEFVDKESDVNLYSSNILDENKVTLEGADNEDVEVNFINENDINLIDISSIGWITGFHSYTLTLSDELKVVINIEMEEKNSDCCTFYEVKQFEIEGYEFKRSIYSDIIRVEI